MKAGVLLTLLLTLCGCSLIPGWTPDLPLIDNGVALLKSVSLVPVVAESPEASGTWTRSLQSGLLKVDGVDSVRFTTAQPSRILDSMGDTPPIVEGTQGLLEVKLIGFDPYYPPSAQLEVNFYLPRRSGAPVGDVIFLERQGTTGPDSATEHQGPWIHFQLDLRTDDPVTMRRLRRYARAQGAKDRGFFSARSVDGGWSLWIIELEGQKRTQLGSGLYPEWSPDGKYLAFQRPSLRGKGWFGIWIVNVEGGPPRQVACDENWGSIQPAWSANSRRIVYSTARNPVTGPNGRSRPVAFRPGSSSDEAHHQGSS